VCTLFLLVLCLTGLPLIFKQEIERLTQSVIQADAVQPGARDSDLDRIIETARHRHPDMVPLFAAKERHDPRIWYVTMATSTAAAELVQVAIDARTARDVGAPRIGDTGFLGIIRSLHVDLFLGLGGQLFLGFMGLIFLLSLISGAAIYAPFLRGRRFGAVRRGRGARSRWLDLHNLLGIATLTWACAVGGTGVVNAGSTLLLGAWQRQVSSQLDAMLEPHDVDARPAASLQSILLMAQSRLPGNEIAFIAFPGTSFADQRHYGVYMRGGTPLTERLVRPVFTEGRLPLTATSPGVPWYLTLLFLSEPLHFGDYGGLPLKFLWAGLDVALIVVLVSGLYLWRTKRRGIVAV